LALACDFLAMAGFSAIIAGISLDPVKFAERAAMWEWWLQQ
jgi:hypothetical protein